VRILTLAVAVALLPASLMANERVSVVNNSPQIGLKDALAAAAVAFDSEDVDAYEMCFKESRRKDMRRRAAVLFASEQCSMELIESHTVEMDEETAEAAVRYKIGNSRCSSEVVSMVRLIKEDGRWVIDKEVKISAGPRSCGPVASASAAPAKGWDPFNPDKTKIPSGLHHLVGDIGIQPGMGCADGKCGVRRCENGRCGL